MIVSPLYLFYKNFKNFGYILGDKGHIFIHSNPDGIKGLFINLIRYIIESIDYMIPLNTKKLEI